MLITTLRNTKMAMGGELELTVQFPQGRVRSKQFEFERRPTILHDSRRMRGARISASR